MDLQELQKIQEEFDRQHAGRIDFYVKITDDHVEALEHLIVCVTGEVGELANLAKKAARGDFLLSSARKEIAGEVADIFAYVLKIANQLDIDLEAAYQQKLAVNRERFSAYSRRENEK